MIYYKIIYGKWKQCDFDPTKRQINLYEDDCKTIFGIGLY